MSGNTNRGHNINDDDSFDLLGDDIPMTTTTNQLPKNHQENLLIDDPFDEQNVSSAYPSNYGGFLDQRSIISGMPDDPFDDANANSRSNRQHYNNDSDIFGDENEISESEEVYNPGDERRGIRGVYKQIKSKMGKPTYGDIDSMDRVDADIDEYDEIIHDHRPPPDKDLGEDIKNMFDIRRYFKKHNDEDDGSPRVIHINDRSTNDRFRYYDNHISTTKYNFVTFVPKFLFEQFSKYANLFFLFTSVIQQVPSVSPTNRYTTIGTLMIVLLVSAVKEISEDLKRNASDNELNRSKIEVLDSATSHYVTKKWINAKVGDIVKVKGGDPFPADLILLSSSEPEGLCYIETANLDGETNLKIKQAKEETAHLMSPQELIRCQGKILSEKPNSSLYTYEGTLYLDGQEIPLNPDQLLLRGANLRNTNWIQGIIIFTGHETKLMRNATATPIKKTDVERIINLQVIALFGILLTLSIVSSIGDVLTITWNKNDIGYLHLEGKSKTNMFFLDLLTYWILFSNLVPISLFVTVEVIKYYQAYLIASDLDMYYEPTDTPTVVRTSSLVEELGQIEYIFSDKTGTLTRNIMEFKTISIGGRCYIGTIPEDKQAEVVDGIEMGYYTFDQLQEDRKHHKNKHVIDEALTLLAACHTVIPEVSPNGTIKYQAASPDEGALVEGAALLGYKFHIRRPSSITMTVDGQERVYELLNICEFNSTRKRMSAIFKCPDGTIKLYVKGADTVILSRLSDDNEFVEATSRQLEDFAVEGLRTLCIASRAIPEEEYKQWSKAYNAAAISLDDRSRKLDEVAEKIEKDLFLLGATAIEDKLQDGVPETIHILQEAGIKIWVLTGDRQETAINIGMSCKLLSDEMNLLVVNEETKADTRRNLQDKLKVLNSNQLSEDDLNSLALVIDGKSLGFALEEDLEDMLLEIGVMCKAVICCRVSPLQKALVVKLVKRKKKALLLAIGDGANDVSMIQAAHVGVGISGMEGMQAARSADFAIGQFKYLKKLLLVHGSWSYQRISLAILFSFYKNITFYMTQFWYVFSNGFSGQSMVESWTLTFYNVIFLVLPPFVLGIFDQYISANMLNQYPKLYKIGQKGHFFNVEIFWSWAINGFYHSAIIYIAAINIFKYGNQLSNGMIADHWAFGVAVYTTCLVTSLGKAALISTQWTKFTLVAIPGSLLLWIILFPIYAVVAPRINVSKEYWGILSHVYGCVVYWTMIICVPVLCLMRDFLWKYYKRTWSPEFYHKVQKIQKYQIQDHKPRFSSFQKTIRKVRQVHRMRKQRGFAFSQVEGQENIVRKYDTTKRRGTYGELE